MPSDLWNNYSFMVWGTMIVINLYVLLFSEILQKRWYTYYNYPNCALVASHHVGAVFYTIVAVENGTRVHNYLENVNAAAVY